jgi:asparagine synthase (glutamine-hydrolysing)
MCGIAGAFTVGAAPPDPGLVRRMAEEQRARGPDDEGVFHDPAAGIALAHRRLSILDLSAAGHQPMALDDRYVISYNGEVYNYVELRAELEALGARFRSGTDTEVLLAAYRQWGAEALSRCNGMWAFALWDAAERTLFCARDRFGIKPFYYWWDGRTFVFASQVTVIASYLRRAGIARSGPADGVVADYLHGVRLDDGVETFMAGIQRLPPGHWLRLRDGQLTVQRWYAMDPAAAHEPVSDEAAFEAYRALFADAVRLRLRSDVPVGSCLSGGLDSSSIVCVAAELLAGGTPQKTFSACYAEFPRYDERPFIDEVVERTGVEPHYVYPTGREFFDEIESFVRVQDEPVGSTSQYAQYRVYRLAGEAGMKVMLDGQGADETISGYHGAYPPYFLDLARGLRLSTLSREVTLYRRLHGYSARSVWTTLGRGLARTAMPAAVYQTLRQRAPAGRSHPFFQVAGGQALAVETSEASRSWARRGALPEYLYRLTTGSSLQSLLRYEDRNSMAFSVEARVPFLDYRLVELAFALPARFKVSGGLTKVVLREAMRGILPERIRTRTDKVGFATPEGQWFRSAGREYMSDIFASRSFAERGYFDAPAVQAAFRAFCGSDAEPPSSTHPEFWTRVNLFWRALNVELWLRSCVEAP